MEVKKEIQGKVGNKEPQSADQQRAAAGLDNTGSTFTFQMHKKSDTSISTKKNFNIQFNILGKPSIKKKKSILRKGFIKR